MTPSSIIGHYRIVAKLGEGGMGQVWRAVDTKLGREVAIKVLPASVASDAERLARFEREALVLASLNHPHIAAIYGVEDRALVMELVEGPTLAERIAEGPLSVEEAARIGGAIAEALEYAHQRGVVHRDVKPANVKLGERVKVLDFGLAKAESGSTADATVTAATQAGVILGTAAYMSPEQASGRAADARSDIFSFGVVLYEMLSARRAFADETSISTMAAILHKEPPALAEVAPHVPVAVEAVVNRCLSKAPAERFASMSAARQALAEAARAGSQPQPTTIAVLPFTNLSADKENEYFSDGLAEEILNALGGVPGLRVIARSSAFAFKGRQEDVRVIGKALSAGHVLEGSVRKAGNRIRVTAQLVDARTAAQLWSERYDRELDDVFAIQDEIAQAIVGTLKMRLTNAGQPLVKRYTSSTEAHHLYLRGGFHLYRMTPEDQSKGRHYLESAVALEPNHAPAWVDLANVYYSRAIQAASPPLIELPKALEAARRAVAADDTLAEAHGALGFMLAACEYNWSGALASVRKALALNPESSKTHFWYAVLLLNMATIGEAIVEFEKALVTDPLSALVNMCLAHTYGQAGRHELAIERSRQALEIVPNFFMAFASLGEAYSRLGRHDEAIDWLEKARPQLPGDFWPTACLGKAYMRAGRIEDAERLLEELEAKRRDGRYVAAEAIGAIAAVLGRHDAAFDWFDTAVAERDPNLTWSARIDPDLAPVRPHPRFQAMLRRMNVG